MIWMSDDEDVFICDDCCCGEIFLSQPALDSHTREKHGPTCGSAPVPATTEEPVKRKMGPASKVKRARSTSLEGEKEKPRKKVKMGPASKVQRSRSSSPEPGGKSSRRSEVPSPAARQSSARSEAAKGGARQDCPPDSPPPPRATRFISDQRPPDNMKKYSCPYPNCQKKYGRKQDQRKHVKSTHEFNQKEYKKCADTRHLSNEDLYSGFQPRIKQETYNLNNSLCSHEAKTLQNLKLHMMAKHIEGEWICVTCKKKLRTKAILSSHRVKCAKSSTFPMKCKYGCGVIVRDRQDNYNHKRRDKCGKSRKGREKTGEDRPQQVKIGG